MSKAIELLKEAVVKHIYKPNRKPEERVELETKLYNQAIAELEKPDCEKLQMLKDYITVNQGKMSQMFFSEKWDVPYTEFTAIAYVLESDSEPKIIYVCPQCKKQSTDPTLPHSCHQPEPSEKRK